MEKPDALAALAALAQDTRLDIFRLLVQAGPDGISAGRIAERLVLPAPTLSFHLAHLRHAGLITCRRESRSLIYAAAYPAMNELMAYLTENCCAGPESRSAAAASTPAAAPHPAIPPKRKPAHETPARARRR